MAENSFGDSSWEKMRDPPLWDAQGHKDYDGYAWYRVKFRVPRELVGKRLLLLLGKIDDFDETYLNGELIGSTGDMKREIERDHRASEYQRLRAYTVPNSLHLTDRENTLAVRVLDIWMHGGIYEGPVGLIEKAHYTVPRERPRSFWDVLRDLFGEIP